MNEEKESVYGEREQKKLVAILIADDKNFEDIIKIIEPERFDNPFLQLIAKICIKFYRTYNCKPDEEELVKEINKAIKKDKRLPEAEILSVLGDILDMVENPESLNYLREEFIEFAKAQKLKAMIMNGAERFKKKPPDELIDGMVKELEEAKSIGKKDSAEELQITNLGDVEAADVEWLWGNRIPLGKLSLIVGDPGGGKSFFTLFMASRITGGGAWPDLLEEEVKIGKVILLTAEDGLADTVRPRVDAMEGDPSKIIIIEGTKETGKLRTFNLAKDVTRLENLIKENPGIRVVIIDPMSAYIGAGGKAKASSHIDADVRGVLAPFKDLAEKYKVAIIGILHLNKNTVLDTIYRVMGSMGWVAAARAVWLIMKDKDYDVTNLRFFTPVKTNLSFEPTSLAFSITDSQRIVFEAGIYNIDIEEQLSRKKTSPIKKALEFLQKQFECVEAEAISVNDIAEEADKERVKDSTLQKAKGMLGIESERREGRWYWRLPPKKEYEE